MGDGVAVAAHAGQVPGHPAQGQALAQAVAGLPGVQGGLGVQAEGHVQAAADDVALGHVHVHGVAQFEQLVVGHQREGQAGPAGGQVHLVPALQGPQGAAAQVLHPGLEVGAGQHRRQGLLLVLEHRLVPLQQGVAQGQGPGRIALGQELLGQQQVGEPGHVRVAQLPGQLGRPGHAGRRARQAPQQGQGPGLGPGIVGLPGGQQGLFGRGQGPFRLAQRGQVLGPGGGGPGHGLLPGGRPVVWPRARSRATGGQQQCRQGEGGSGSEHGILVPSGVSAWQ